MSQNQIAAASFDSAVVAYTDKKGMQHSRTVEAAIVKGGEALRTMAALAPEIALHKAGNGRYQAAAEIVLDAFPKALKGFRLVYGEQAHPWENKARFTMFIDIAYAQTPAAGKDWTKKQAKLRPFVIALHRLTQGGTESSKPGEVVGEASPVEIVAI